MSFATDQNHMQRPDPPHILVVDDEKIIREGSERILAGEGWRVSTAENGLRGLEVVESDGVHMVLLDLMMPGISGMDVLKRLRLTHPHLLVIVITGYATIENAVEAMKTGAYDFIPKPFNPDQLRIVVRRGIDKLCLEYETARLRSAQEKSLRDIAEEQSKMHTIITHMVDGLLVTDAQGAVVLYNPAAVDMLLLEGKDPLGKDIGASAGYHALSEMITEALSGHDVGTPDSSREIRVDGSALRYIEARTAAVRTSEGDIIGTVTILHDITLFRELDRMKSDFVDLVSHELRSPLGSIRQQLSVLRDGLAGAVTGRQEEIIARLQGRIDGQIGMVSNLLDLSRIEAGRFAEQKERVNLPEVIGQAVDMLSAEAESKSIAFEIMVDAGLPAIHADRQSMDTVFRNLVGNAVKYTGEGGRILINASAGDGMIEVSVADTGIGIATADISRIFDRFYRIRSEQTRKVIGSGLGLPLTRSIIEKHSGTITVTSTPGEGTTFTVRLPLPGTRDMMQPSPR